MARRVSLKTLCSTLVFFLIVLLIYYSSNNLTGHREEVRVLSEALSLKEALSFKNFKDDENSKKMEKKLLEENERNLGQRLQSANSNSEKNHSHHP